MNQNAKPAIDAPARTRRMSGGVNLWLGDCSPGEHKNVKITPESGTTVTLGLPATIRVTMPDCTRRGAPNARG